VLHHLGEQNRRLERQLDVRNLRLEHLLDVDHPGVVRHRRHLLGVDRLGAGPDLDRRGAGQDAPYPAKEQTGCYLDAKLGEECPYPEPKRTGCCPDEGC
jgi:hypothetical protein